MIQDAKWTNAEIRKLKVLSSLGATMQQAAETLGKTRNAVAGKAQRCGIPFGRKQEIEQPKRVSDTKKKLPGRVFFTNANKKVEEAEEIGTHLLFAGEYDCRWPLDKMRCCGRKIHHGSYCEEHANIAYVAGSNKFDGKPAKKSIIWLGFAEERKRKAERRRAK